MPGVIGIDTIACGAHGGVLGSIIGALCNGFGLGTWMLLVVVVLVVAVVVVIVVVVVVVEVVVVVVVVAVRFDTFARIAVQAFVHLMRQPVQPSHVDFSVDVV